VALRVVLVGSEVVVVVEVPLGELRRRDAARDRVREAQHAVPALAAALEDRVVHGLVQQHGHVEEREALQYRDGNPVERVLEVPQRDAADRHYPELAPGIEQVLPGVAAVELLELVVGDGIA
jgi:hypothetical protein